MDDANVPSLLSIPYLGYKSQHDPNRIIEKNTLNFVWSRENRYFFQGKFGEGIGSPHTTHGSIWPMSIIIKALSTNNSQEIEKAISILEQTDAGTNFIHESFMPNNPTHYTRRWFAWANSLFGQLIVQHKEYLEKSILK